MKRLDRHLAWELTKFTLLALASVVLLYILIDLFEELSYFTTRRVHFVLVLLNYLYELPSAITLLYPASLLLAVFVVYGQAVRDRELQALLVAGIATRRLFAPAVALGVISVVLYLVGNELVTIPFTRRQSELRRYRIERRAVPTTGRRQNLYMALGDKVVYARELEGDTVIRDITVITLSPLRHVVERVDAREAVFADGVWRGSDVTLRLFDSTGTALMTESSEARLSTLTLKPEELGGNPRPMPETPTRELRTYISRMRRAGENVAAEEVEYNYRFSYSLVGLIVTLLGLPISVRLRHGGVMLGLGIGLLVSFLYWGAIQVSRAYGTAHVISPSLAAWLPNAVFGTAAVLLFLNAER